MWFRNMFAIPSRIFICTYMLVTYIDKKKHNLFSLCHEFHIFIECNTLQRDQTIESANFSWFLQRNFFYFKFNNTKTCLAIFAVFLFSFFTLHFYQSLLLKFSRLICCCVLVARLACFLRFFFAVFQFFSFFSFSVFQFSIFLFSILI